MSTLTDEQRKRIEENRRKALEKRALKSGISINGSNHSGSVTPLIKPSLPNSSFASKPATGSATSEVKYAPIFITSGVQKSEINFIGSNQSLSAISPVKTSVPNLSSSSKPIITSQIKQASVFPTVGSTNNINKQNKNLLKSPETRGTCVLMSRKRFYVDIGYHKDVIEIFKSVPGRLYDMQTKKWNFSIDDHDKLISLLKPLQPDVFVIPLPRTIVKIFQQAEENKEIKEYDLSHMDQVLVNALLPFQKVGLYFGIQHGGKVLLADDMGLGKTIQGIAIANYFIKDWPLLVVTPSSVRYSWLEAFQMWLPSVGAHEISVINSGKDHIPDDKVIIVSYDLLAKMQTNIINRRFKSVIFDESHFLKNYKAARTKAAQAVMRNMQRIVMLSGTPALSRPIELFTQVSALCPKHFPNFNDYGIRYCSGRQQPWGWDFSGSSNMGELKLLMEEFVMIRRLKSDVLGQLPSKCRQMVLLDPSHIAKKNKILHKLAERMRQLDVSGMERRGALLEYFHETGAVKIPAVCEYIIDLLESDKKFLCFAHHQNVINGICNAIEKKKIDYIRIDGTVPSEQRKKLCDHFQMNDSCKVAVLSITAANCGITLTAASLVIFAELFWNPGILTQAEDRAHRIGQEDSVLVQYLVARGTADDEIWPLVQRKLDILNKAGLSKDNFKSADTIVKDDPTQAKLDELWSGLELSQPSDFDCDPTPEKRLKLG